MQLEAAGKENGHLVQLERTAILLEGGTLWTQIALSQDSLYRHTLTEQISHKVTIQIKSRGGLGFWNEQ